MPITPKSLTSVSAYVQQDDLFIGTLTVQEHLNFQVCDFIYSKYFEIDLTFESIPGCSTDGQQHTSRKTEGED